MTRHRSARKPENVGAEKCLQKNGRIKEHRALERDFFEKEDSACRTAGPKLAALASKEYGWTGQCLSSEANQLFQNHNIFRESGITAALKE